MGYVVVDDFRQGQDNRNPAVVGTPGSLVTLENAHITRGGRIQRSKSFVPKFSLPAGKTFGLHAQGDRLFTFGGLAEPSGMPAGVSYQRLTHTTDTLEVYQVVSTENFDGLVYAIAEYEDGAVFHYYDGTRVTSWDSLVIIDSLEGVAKSIMNKINLDGVFDVTQDGAVLTLTAIAANTEYTVTKSAVNVTGTDDQDITLTKTVSAAAGVSEVWTAEFTGTFDDDDLFTITIDGVDYSTSAVYASMGRTALTFKTKMYSTAMSLLRFSAINTPTGFASGIGFGNLNLANQNSGSEELTAIGKYQGDLALFSRSAIQVQYVDVDETLNEHLHTIEGTGTRSPRTATQFGSVDLLYLDEKTGIRSLRARDSSNAPSVDDIGVAIDTHILGYMATLTDRQIANAIGFIADEGRYWLCIGSRIYVYSYFHSSKIAAWSYYSPGFEIEAVAVVGRKIYVRSGDTVYLYGGDDGATYPVADETPVAVTLPFLDLKKPATFKTIEGMDQAGLNTWSVELLLDPDDDTNKTTAVSMSNTTYSFPKQGSMDIRATHIAPKLTCAEAGNAELYNFALHYTLDEAA